MEEKPVAISAAAADNTAVLPDISRRPKSSLGCGVMTTSSCTPPACLGALEADVKTFLRFSPVLLLCLLASPVRAAEPPAAGVAFFENKIRPVLVEQCYSCHSVGAGKAKGGLQLDTKASLLKGGDSGAALVPGKPEQSLILKAIRHEGDNKMPPKGKLADTIAKDFAQWISMGAPDPRDGNVAVAKGIDWAAARKFWSFQPVKKPALPAVKDTAWASTDIDRFILAELEKKNLRPVTAADKRTLIRRASFDLIGLPPPPEEVEAFLKDDSPEAFAKVIDRLLSSPHYGERWGRYWLDVARYAEDQAHTFGVKPYSNAWRYRDWVIDALNADMPYDQFVKLQIAADLMDDGSDKFIKHRPAVGFFGLGAQYYKGNDKVVAEELDDRVDTLVRGFLALTVSCARCHDHKFDPIPTQDYYSLAGVFFSTKLSDVALAPKAEVERFEMGQKQVAEMDKKLKDFVKAEKTRVAEAKVADIAAYMLAARKVQARRMEKPNYSTGEQAKADKLNPAVLDRWVKYLEPNSKVSQKVMALSSWRKLPQPAKGNTDMPADVVQTAKEFQDYVEAILKKQPVPGTNKPVDDKTRNEVIDGLFGDKGVFAVGDGELMGQLPMEKKQQMEAMKGELEKRKKEVPPAPPSAHAISESTAADMKVFVRGDPKQQGEVAPRRFLRVLSTDNPAPFKKGSGRLELADAIASKDNPLTARVIVNRIWQHHFGRGIVGTPSNFGQLGERPTHPELLDHLAARLVESGWSMKKLHREIMLSRTYQLASNVDATPPSQAANPLLVDPDNRMLWRMNRRRLEVEVWRDSLLVAAGELDRAFGGPTLELNADSNRRRTVYAKISRHELNGLLRLFDFPDANITSESRTETTVPQQQLFVLNSPFFVARAKALAARLQKQEGDDAARVRLGYQIVYSRSASDGEVEVAKRYLAAKDAPEEKNQLSRWERYCQALLAGNEFLYID
jgi:hypothetical protein